MLGNNNSHLFSTFSGVSNVTQVVYSLEYTIDTRLRLVNVSGTHVLDATNVEYTLVVGDTAINTTSGYPLKLLGPAHYVVDWGDSTSTTVTDTAKQTHTYSAPGVYSITVTGEISTFHPGGVQRIILYGVNWGDSMVTSFQSVPIYPGQTHLVGLFANQINIVLTAAQGQAITDLDVSGIQSMSNLFSTNPKIFDYVDVTGWDVGAVTNFWATFQGLYPIPPSLNTFNNALESYPTNLNDVSKYSDFNQNISGWDVSSGVYFRRMFGWNKDFNQDISSWNMSNAVALMEMFSNCPKFNQDISSWDVSNVTTFNSMFRGPTGKTSDATTSVGIIGISLFNQDISSWDTSSCTDFTSMFSLAHSFDQDIGAWDLSSATTMYGMFSIISTADTPPGMSQTNFENTLIGWANNVNTADNVYAAAFCHQAFHGNSQTGAVLNLANPSTAYTAYLDLLAKGWTLSGIEIV